MGGAAPDVDALEPMARAALAAAWTEIARDEHASVGAFAELSQRLLAAGAPPSLIAQCHRAAIEEVDHAQRAFGFAGAYAGRPIGPAALEMPAAGKRDGSLPGLAAETLLDGCLGEGVAATLARVGSGRAVDPVVAEVLETIADDERGHAELAWEILRFCLDAGGAPVARRLRAQRLPRRMTSEALLPESLAAHGLPTRADLTETQQKTRAEVERRLATLLARYSQKPVSASQVSSAQSVA